MVQRGKTNEKADPQRPRVMWSIMKTKPRADQSTSTDDNNEE